MSDLRWHAQALCADADPSLFFPKKGDTATINAAKRICAACPVSTPCLEYAIETEQEYGIWAGLGRDQRQRLVRLSRRGGAA